MTKEEGLGVLEEAAKKASGPGTTVDYAGESRQMRREGCLDLTISARGRDKKINAARDKRSSARRCRLGVVSGGTMTTTAVAGFTQRGASLLVLAAITMAPTIAAADKGGSHLCAPNYCAATGGRAPCATGRHVDQPRRIRCIVRAGKETL